MGYGDSDKNLNLHYTYCFPQKFVRNFVAPILHHSNFITSMLYKIALTVESCWQQDDFKTKKLHCKITKNLKLQQSNFRKTDAAVD